MDQIKIGKFIASCRKEQGMTQVNLAEHLGISDRAVSKWETGKSMPDSGLMLELCQLLIINVNELLSGERIRTEVYNKRAEDNLLQMKREVEAKDRQLLRMEWAVSVPVVLAGFLLLFLAALFEIPVWLRSVLVLSSLVVIFAAGLVATWIEQKAGFYECGHCHHRHVPAYWQTNLSMHIGRTRLMKCPQCGELSWQRKVLTPDDSEVTEQ